MMSFCLCAFGPRVQDDPPLVPLAVGHHLPYTASAEVRHERRVSSVTRRYVVPAPPGVPLLGSNEGKSYLWARKRNWRWSDAGPLMLTVSLQDD